VKAEEQPVYGGTFIMGIYGDPVPGLIPDVSLNFAVRHAVSPIYERLLMFSPDNSKLVPGLAETWETSADGLSWIFHLVRNATWHDGVPFTSADVKYTFEAMLLKYVGMYSDVAPLLQSIDTPDNYTVVFAFKAPVVYFPNLLPYYGAYILPMHLYNGTDVMTNPFNQKPVGTGPFIFQEYVKGDHITVVRNPNYRITGLPYLDKVIFRIMPDRAQRILAMDTHEIDALPWFPSHYEAVPGWQKDPYLVVKPADTPSFAVVQVLINNNRTILNDLRVRKALALAINKTYMVEKAYYGFGIIAHNAILDRWEPYYNPDAAQSEYDVTEANRLLDEAGYTKDADGIRFSLELEYDPSVPEYLPLAESCAAFIRKNTGIVVKLVPLETAIHYKRMAEGNYDLGILVFSGGPDPTRALAMYWGQNIKNVVGTNNARFVNATYDDLYVKQQVEVNSTKRVQMIKDMQTILKEQEVCLWIAENIGFTVYPKKFKNYPQDSAHFETFAVVWDSSLEPSEEPTTAPTVPYELIVAVVVIIVAVIAVFAIVRKRRKAR
jgi:peptide/nickel transport system substrate-binding protein